MGIKIPRVQTTQDPQTAYAKWGNAQFDLSLPCSRLIFSLDNANTSTEDKVFIRS